MLLKLASVRSFPSLLQRDYELKTSQRHENWHDYKLAYIDRILIKAFPIMFLVFNVIYWPICLT
jgi:hypothetical protein